MQRLVMFYLPIILLLGACSGKPKAPEILIDRMNAETDSLHYANLEFLEDFFDFGSITQGEVVAHTFRFKNTGNRTLIIKDVIPSCGCTKSKISRKKLDPAEESTIEVIFDSSGWRGLQYKSITLRTNSPIREKSVTIKANVVDPE